MRDPVDKRVKALRVKWLSKLLESNPNNIEVFLADKLISKNNLGMGLDILKGYSSFYIKTIKHSFYKEACLAWLDMNFVFSPCNHLSIKNLWIYENILLQYDDGRVYKPPWNYRTSRRVINMPYFFRDLPFPILNRRPDEASLINSINQAFARIPWNQTHNAFHTVIDNDIRSIEHLTFKDIYWNLFVKETLPKPWKAKWENILQTSQIDWPLFWKNANDSLLNYKVQSTLWMMTNLGFISSNRLNRIYGTSNTCRQCNEAEESPAHCFLYCNVSTLVYEHFQNSLIQLIGRNISFAEKAFGILIEDFSSNRPSRLANYLISSIKSIVFRRRARITTLDELSKANILIQEIRKYISHDLQLKFNLAKIKNRIPHFQNNFLIQEVLGKIEDNELVFSNILE